MIEDPDSAPRSAATETVAPDGAEPGTVRRFSLRVVGGAARGASFSSRGPRTVVGTHTSTDFVLADAAMSRFHCELVIQGGVATVRDLGSRNGVFVDGVRVHVAPLSHGAVLTLGRTQIRFELGTDHARIRLSDHDHFGLLAGGSATMRAVFALLERAAGSDITVLLQGETGTGKDLAAHSIHQASARADGPLIVVDSGAIPADLLESELFGHERGAFTGADRSRQGAFEAASGGTLFLDEIGELSLDLQPKILRALESRRIRRLGSTATLPIDVRVIAATNRDLLAEVNSGRFRLDLYYRLAVMQVTLPPLREHPEDIPGLVASLLDSAGRAEDAAALLARPGLLASLTRHTWAGNVRELRNYLERCLALRDDVPLGDHGGAAAPPPPIDSKLPLRQTRQRWLSYFERRYLEQILRDHDDNVSAAARAAGLDRVHFHRLLVRNGLR